MVPKMAWRPFGAGLLANLYKMVTSIYNSLYYILVLDALHVNQILDAATHGIEILMSPILAKQGTHSKWTHGFNGWHWQSGKPQERLSSRDTQISHYSKTNVRNGFSNHRRLEHVQNNNKIDIKTSGKLALCEGSTSHRWILVGKCQLRRKRFCDWNWSHIL